MFDLKLPVFIPLRANFAAAIGAYVTWPVFAVSDTAAIERITDA